MALFDIKPSLSFAGTGAVSTEESETVKFGGPDDRLRDAIGTIDQGKGICFVTAGSWALHDLLKYVLLQTGPADVVGFTWSITVPAAMMILKQKECGNIRSMSFVIDASMSRWSVAAMTILKNHSEKVVRAAIHAKGFLVKNDKWTVSVVGSANFSNNPRIEAGHISTDPEAFRLHQEWTSRLLSGEGEPFAPADSLPLPEQSTAKELMLIRCDTKARPAFLDSCPAVFSDSDYFLCENGMVFSANEVSKAAASCLNSVRDAMDDNTDSIVVINPFESEECMEPYLALSKRYGYTVKSMTVGGGRC